MVQIRIKKTLSEGLLYVIICSKEINKPEDAEAIKMNEFNEYVREVFSAAGDIVIRSMMGGYLVYLNGKLIGDICDNEVFLKERRHRTGCLKIPNCVIRTKSQRH